MQGLPEAMRAFAAAARFAYQRDHLEAGSADSLIMPHTPVLDGPTKIMSEHDAKQASAKYGLASPASRIVAPAEARKGGGRAWLPGRRQGGGTGDRA